MTNLEIRNMLGQRLRALRRARGLTMIEAAKRAGLNRLTVSHAEVGRNPSLETLIRLLRVYGSLGSLNLFIPEAPVSPMEVIEASQRD